VTDPDRHRPDRCRQTHLVVTAAHSMVGLGPHLRPRNRPRHHDHRPPINRPPPRRPSAGTPGARPYRAAPERLGWGSSTGRRPTGTG
jgi:hypothetical protein